MRDEHDFKKHQTQESWDKAVFDNAASFSVFAKDIGKADDIHAFSDAVLLALSWGGGALIYAITASGRSTCIPRSTWSNLLHGRMRTRLRKGPIVCDICNKPGGKTINIDSRHVHPSCWRTERLK
jgi:hypothetical protein